VLGDNNTFEKSIVCPAPKVAISVGISGVGALNNVIAVAIAGDGLDEGYYRVRLRAGSQPSDVTAQLMCANIASY
jgi:hypothetical protein